MRRLRTRDWLLGTSAGIVVAGLTVASQLAFADRTSAAPAPATPASSTQVPAASTVGDPPQPGGPQPLPALARVTATSARSSALSLVLWAMVAPALKVRTIAYSASVASGSPGSWSIPATWAVRLIAAR